MKVEMFCYQNNQQKKFYKLKYIKTFSEIFVFLWLNTHGSIPLLKMAGMIKLLKKNGLKDRAVFILPQKLKINSNGHCEKKL